MRVWVTRAEPGASATAARLRLRAHVPLAAPLLSVLALPPPAPAPQGAALAFTSANAVRAFAGWSDGREWPVFAVGEATAHAALAAGFETVSSAGGDVRALAALIAAARPPGVVLHPCGRERAGDLQGLLAACGVSLAPVILYETQAVDVLPAEPASALQALALDVALLHSPKAARVLAALLAPRPERERAALSAVALSPACARPLAGLGLKRVEIAGASDEASLLERLG